MILTSHLSSLSLYLPWCSKPPNIMTPFIVQSHNNSGGVSVSCNEITNINVLCLTMPESLNDITVRNRLSIWRNYVLSKLVALGGSRNTDIIPLAVGARLFLQTM